MFKFLKKNTDKIELDQTDINIYALRLLIHLALSDGEIDESEISELKKFIQQYSLSEDLASYLEREINDVEISSSFLKKYQKLIQVSAKVKSSTFLKKYGI